MYGYVGLCSVVYVEVGLCMAMHGYVALCMPMSLCRFVYGYAYNLISGSIQKGSELFLYLKR